ncbi:polysialyltransferase family glycosyltransferase [Streptomyces sp. MI02-7b]|uniref:polysialyltransferase family glycosyltransferase n=1 Tax=Streptomyces sp. MI02-7b TaxID=462941 RepID=UPI0029AF6CFC|nr:polysialyltransferase family glycosyltransferase [Streptomyces sp. MI02-7b]MDX3071954.1 polysialyltransferase family glycosyltransferase [Streptomyces sp. MI02-7b]
MGRTQVFLAGGLTGVAALAAALDAGLFTPADRRLLLISNNAPVPEISPAADAMAGFEALRGRFDRVLSWNEAIAPLHPRGWSPRPDDVPMWERHLRRLWDLGDDELELVVESLHVDPALALVNVFTGAPVVAYADGLTAYGPSPNKLEPLVTTRVGRLLHLGLVPGLRPLMLSEYGVPEEVVPAEAFTKVLAEVATAAELTADGDTPPKGGALLLGQHLSALEILSDRQEEELHVRMLRGAVAAGHRTIVFKPHPTAPAHRAGQLEREAAELGAELRVADPAQPAEVLFQSLRPELVVGCFSTALFTAYALYGLPVARTGTGTVLERLTVYADSTRVPVTIADRLLPDLADGAAATGWTPPAADRVATELAPLLRAVAFCMQPQMYASLRDETAAYLSNRLNADSRRYFTRRRLSRLALPGGVPAQLAFLPNNPAVRRAARRLRHVARRG